MTNLVIRLTKLDACAMLVITFTEYVGCYFRASLCSDLNKDFMRYIFFPDILNKLFLLSSPVAGILSVKNEFRSLFIGVHINASLI